MIGLKEQSLGFFVDRHLILRLPAGSFCAVPVYSDLAGFLLKTRGVFNPGLR